MYFFVFVSYIEGFFFFFFFLCLGYTFIKCQIILSVYSHFPLYDDDADYYWLRRTCFVVHVN